MKSSNESEGRFYLKFIEAGGLLMAAIADEEVLGREAYDPRNGVRIRVSREFYGGRLVGVDEVVEALDKADVLILAGDRCINLAVRLGYVNPQSILRIGDLSHAQVMKFGY